MAEVATHDPAALMEDLRGFVMDEEREVTYKFLCSNLSISSDLAKRWVAETPTSLCCC